MHSERNPNLENEPTLCAACGFRARKRLRPDRAIRDSFVCTNCKAALRHRDMAQLVLDEFGKGERHLAAFANTPRFDVLTIFEPGIRGPFVNAFGKYPNFLNSYYWEDVPYGEMRDGVRCENLCELTLPSDSFDLMISIDVFEHVFNPEQAFKEVARVLKPGGLHIFSVPVPDPMPAKSRTRAVLKDGNVRHILPPQYHVAGNNDRSLVVTEWGLDIIEMHARVSLDLSIVRRSAPAEPHAGCQTFIARRRA